MAGKIPWQYSDRLGREYVYVPSRDEIVFKNGSRLRRPAQWAVSLFESATYEGNFGRDSSDDDGEDEYKPAPGPGNTDDVESRTPRGVQQIADRLRKVAISREKEKEKQKQKEEEEDDDDDDDEEEEGEDIEDKPPSELYQRRRDAQLGPRAQVNVQASNQGRRNTTIDQAEVEDGRTEELFPDYKIRKHAFFFVGKVFSILWSEPAGSTAAPTGADSITVAPYGQKVYSQIRRFVVIRQGDNYCNALPISTYGGRGVAKPGVKKSEHAVIYTTPKPPPYESERAKRGEDPMRPDAIRMDPDSPDEKLDPKSRINFGHLHTIQHNIRAKSCGKVPREHQNSLLNQFAHVFKLPGATPPSSQTVGRAPVDTASTRSGTQTDGGSTTTTEAGGSDPVVTVRKLIRKYIDQGMSGQEAIAQTAAILRERGSTTGQTNELIRRALAK